MTAITRKTHPTASRPMYPGMLAPDLTIGSTPNRPVKSTRKETITKSKAMIQTTRPLRREAGRHTWVTGKNISAIAGRSDRAKLHHPLIIGADSGERSTSAMPHPIRMRAPPPAARRTPARRLKTHHRSREARRGAAAGAPEPRPALLIEPWTGLPMALGLPGCVASLLMEPVSDVRHASTMGSPPTRPGDSVNARRRIGVMEQTAKESDHEPDPGRRRTGKGGRRVTSGCATTPARPGNGVIAPLRGGRGADARVGIRPGPAGPGGPGPCTRP